MFFGPDPIAIAAFKNHDGITYVAKLKNGTLEPRAQPLKPFHPKDKVGSLKLDEIEDAL
jgi:hypothetical protein